MPKMGAGATALFGPNPKPDSQSPATRPRTQRPKPRTAAAALAHATRGQQTRHRQVRDAGWIITTVRFERDQWIALRELALARLKQAQDGGKADAGEIVREAVAQYLRQHKR
jgi:hypothetical protein